jgi:hypothetical protein
LRGVEFLQFLERIAPNYSLRLDISEQPSCERLLELNIGASVALILFEQFVSYQLLSLLERADSVKDGNRRGLITGDREPKCLSTIVNANTPLLVVLPRHLITY